MDIIRGVKENKHTCRSLGRLEGIQRRSSYLPAPESQAIRIHSRALARAPSNIIIAFQRESFLSLGFELIRIGGHGGKDIVQHSRSVDLVLEC